MRKVRDLDGGPDARDIPQEPRKVALPVPPGQPAPLTYYVTSGKPVVKVFGPGDVTACTTWAREQAMSQAARFDVREIDTALVFFSFTAKGRLG